jgi:hypothetical protein
MTDIDTKDMAAAIELQRLKLAAKDVKIAMMLAVDLLEEINRESRFKEKLSKEQEIGVAGLILQQLNYYKTIL